MLRGKISDKLKIVSVVLAVVIVAGAAIAFISLSSNKVSDAQASLSAGQNGVSTYATVQTESNGVKLSASGKYWSAYDAAPTSIGRYNDSGAIISSSVELSADLTSAGVTVTGVTVSGKAFDGETEITDCYDEGNGVKVRKAGKYTAVIALSNNTTATLYAQVDRMQLELDTGYIKDESYNPDGPINPFFQLKSKTTEFEGIVSVNVVSGTDHLGGSIDVSDEQEINYIKDTYGCYVNIYNAGVYSIDFDIEQQAQNYYEWKTPANASNPHKYNISNYTVKQLQIKYYDEDLANNSGFYDGDIYNDENNHVEYVPNMSKAFFTKSAINFTFGNIEGVDAILEFYTDWSCTKVVQDFVANKKQQIFAKMIGIIDTDGTHKISRNYVLSQYVSPSEPFYIVPKKLNSPSATDIYFTTDLSSEFSANDVKVTDGKTITANYKVIGGQAFNYQLWQFFKYNLVGETWESDYLRGQYWNVTVDGVTIDDVNTYSITDVKRVDPNTTNSQVLSYAVSITPINSNYEWRSGNSNAVNFTVTINPYEIFEHSPLITWKDDGIVYTGEDIDYLDSYYQVTSLLGNDLHFMTKLSNAGREEIHEIGDDGKPTDKVIGYKPIVNAGNNYSVYVYGITGEDAHNYNLIKRLVSDDYPYGGGFEHAFVVNKKMLGNYSGTTVVTGAFNGQMQTFADGFTDKIVELGLAYVNDGNGVVIPFVGPIAAGGIKLSVNSGEDGVAINDHSASVYFGSDFKATHAGYYTLTLTFIDSTWKNNLCWYNEGGDQTVEEYVWRNFAYIAPVVVTPSLGQYQHISTESAYVDMSTLLTGTVSGVNTPVYEIAGYGVLDEDTLDTVKSNQRDVDFANGKFKTGDYFVLLQIKDGLLLTDCKFVEADGIEVLQNGRQAVVHYSVGDGANVKTKITNYTYGDNIVGSLSGIDSVVNVTCTNYTIATKSFKIYSDETLANEVTGDALSNGLPRNAGKYYVQVTVTFIDTEVDTWVGKVSFTVNKKVVAVNWTVDGVVKTSLTYDANQHTVGANITQIDGSTTVVLSVANAANTNAGTYTYSQSDLTMADTYSANYALQDTSFSLQINPIEITVKAIAGSIVFGEKVAEDHLNHTLAGAFLSGDADKSSVWLYDGDTRVTDLNATLSAGRYTLVPVWDGEQPTSVGTYTVTRGNYKLTMQSATFTVSAQSIVITLKSDGSSMYGDELDFYNNNVVSVEGISLEDLANYVTITANTKTDGSGVAASKTAARGAYYLRATLKSEFVGVYELTVNNDDSATYEITRREVTVRANELALVSWNTMPTAKNRFDVVSERGFIDSVIFSSKAALLLSDNTFSGNRSTVTTDGEYFHQLLPSSGSTSDSRSISGATKNADGMWQYVKELTNGVYNNYRITIVMTKITVTPRPIAITFNTGDAVSCEYGSLIDLLRQSDEVLGLDETKGTDAQKDEKKKRKRNEYIICTSNNNFTDNNAYTLADIVKFTLVRDGIEYDPAEVIVDAGVYTIKVTFTNATFTLAENNPVGTYTVKPKTVNVALNADVTGSVYGEPLAGSLGNYTVTGGEQIEGLGTLNVYDGETLVEDVSTLPAGTYSVRLTPGNGNYNVIADGVTFTVTPREITITAKSIQNVYGEDIGNKLIDSSNYTVLCSPDYQGAAIVNNDDLGITLIVQNNGVNVANDAIKTLPYSGNGNYTIKVSYDTTNNNYDVSPGATATFTVQQREITVDIADVERHIYGTAFDGDFDYEVRITNGTGNAVIGTDITFTLGVYYTQGGAQITDFENLPVGDYVIDATYAQNSNYNVTVNTGTFTVGTLDLTITFKPEGASSVYGEPVDATKAFDVVGLLTGDKVNITAKLNGNEVELDSTSSVGTYVITVTAGGNYNVIYAGGVKSGTYKITPRNITITANAVSNVYGDTIDNKLIDASAYTVTADGSYVNAPIVNGNNLNIKLVVRHDGSDVNDADIPSLDGTTYDLKVSYDTANGNYNVTVAEEAKFTVTPRELTLTFTPDGGTSVYGSSINLYDTTVGTLTNYISGRHTYEGLVTLALSKDGSEVNATYPSVDVYTVTATLDDGMSNNYNLAIVGTGKYAITPATIQDVTSLETTRTVDYTGSAHTFTAVSGKQVTGQSATVRYILTDIGVTVGENSARWDTSDASATVPQVTNAGNYTLHVLVSAANHNGVYLTSDLIVNSVTLTVAAKDVAVKYGSALALSADNKLTADDYTYVLSSTILATSLNGYLNALTYTTNYTTTTAAGAQNIAVTPVYSPAFDGNVNVVCASGAVTVEKADMTGVSVSAGYNGVYTGTAYAMFAGMTATTVDGITPAWQYRKVGSSAWTTYANQTVQNVADSGKYEVKVTATNHNDVVLDGDNAITIAITKNSITITVANKSITYGDDIATVTFTAALISSANGLPSTDSYVNAVAAACSVNGYTTTTAAGSKLNINSTYTGDANVTVTVVKGELTVTTRSITITFGKGGTSVYGDPVNISGSGVFTYSCVFANSDTLDDVVSVSVKDSDNVTMAQTNPHAGSYTVSVSLANTNYSIALGNGKTSGVYTIAKRPISVNLPDANASVEYAEDGSNLHGGKYGAAHNAVLTGELINTLTLNDDYTVTYDTVEGDGQVAQAAPTKAGNYVVTVTLTNGNYIFADNKTAVEFDFVVNKKVLNASEYTWEKHVIEYKNNVPNTNVITAYNADIMEIATFTKTIASQNKTTDVLERNSEGADSDNYYYFNGDKQLCIHALGRAKYEVMFGLNAEASNNYKFDGWDTPCITVLFYIANTMVELTVNVTGWQYTDTPEASNFHIAVNSGEPIYGLDCHIAPFNGDTALWNSLLAQHNQDGFKGIEAANMTACYGELVELDFSSENLPTTLSTLATYDVGRYVIHVEYDGIIGSGENADFMQFEKYDIVEVSKKELQSYLPAFEAATYKGTAQQLSVVFDAKVNGVPLDSIIDAEFNNNNILSGNSISATNKGEYKVTFTVKSTYQSKYTMHNNSAEAVVTWTVNKDTAQNNGQLTVADFTGIYGTEVTLPTPTTATGYNGNFSWQFATKVDDNRPDDFVLSDKPRDAGSYWVKITLSDTNDNFGDKVAYAVLTIDKATLRVTAMGSLTYGEPFAQSNCTYTVNVGDLKSDDTVASVTISGSATYDLVDATANKSKLAVKTGGHALTATASTLTADNYNIQIENGTFTVKPLAVTVKIGSVANRQYGWAIDLSSVTVTEINDNELAKNELLAGVKAKLYVAKDSTSADATATSPVDTYAIMSRHTDDNFAITWQNGTYEIVQRQVTVNLTNGGGSYKGAITAVSYTATVVDENGNVSNLATSEGFVVTPLYENSAVLPSNAGNYNVTVSANGNDNYILADNPTLTFVITKFVVDCKFISADTEMYKGVAIDPAIVIADGSNFDKTVFDVVAHADFIQSGPHTVTLRLNDPDNYEWLDIAGIDATITFTIAKAGIYAIPSATITYGQEATNATVILKFVYAESGAEVPAGIVEVDDSEIEYIFVNSDIDRARPEVGTYKFTLKADNGFVNGCSSSDYNIALQKDAGGNVICEDYVVKKKEIAIVAGSSTSKYWQTVTLSNSFTLATGSELAWDDKLENVIVNYVPATTATATSPVGPYVVTATADSHKNYAITVDPGTHTIEQLEVDVVLSATNGVYGGEKATVSVASLTAPATESMLTINMVGTQNNGAKYSDSAIPVNAGSYRATVTAISDSNFKLGTITEATFVVEKKVVSQNIEITPKTYNGYAQSHGLHDTEAYEVSTTTYRNVGSHDVTITLKNKYNYAWDGTTGESITKQFVINPAKLTLTPTGTFTYGDKFDSSMSKLNFTVEGLKGNDTAEVLSGDVIYALSGDVDGSKLVATAEGEGYDLVIANVSALTATNYTITANLGKLVVNKRNITIQPVASTSVYSQDVVLSNDYNVVDGTSFVNGDDKSAISVEYKLKQSVTEVGEYDVTATWSSANYIVTVVDGKHTIVPIKVGVVIRAIDREYDDGKTGEAIEFVTIVATNLGEKPEPITSNLKFVINYSGTANNNLPIDSNEVPALAGMYTVTVRDVDSENYTIDRAYVDGIPSVVTVIDRKTVDADKIVAQSTSYTGSSIRPTIVDTLYNVDGKIVYDVSYGEGYENGFVKVGNYPLTLTLRDTANYCWRDNLNPYQTITFKLAKANNAIVDENGNVLPNGKIEISGWTVDDKAKQPSINLAYGSDDAVFEYSTSANGFYSTVVPANAGTYYVRAIVATSNNYNSYVSEPVQFVIAKRTVAVPAVSNPNENNVYTGEMLSLNISNYDDSVMSLDCELFSRNANGTLTLSALNAGKYTATLTLRNSDNYEWADKTNTTDKVVINWTVERQVLKVLVSDGRKIVVTGEDIVFIPDGFNSGIMTIRDNVRAHEGHYSAVITLKDSANYAWEGIDGDTITVEFELTGTNTVFVALMCVVAGLCVGLGAMALILMLIHRRKKRQEAADIDSRSRADGWNE